MSAKLTCGSLNGFSKKFKNKKVLYNICVELDSGIYGLLGPNGAGKTTFMRTITGVYDDKKTITYDDVVVDQKFIRNNIGYLPQKFSVLKEMTVYEGLEYIGRMKKIPIKELRTEIDEMLERVHLTEEKEKKMCRVYSKNPVGEKIDEVGIEDGYICVLKK